MDTGERSDPHRNAAGFQKRHKLTYPILMDLDGSIAGRYAVEGFPTNVIIDAKGIVRYAQGGFDADAVHRIINNLTR